MRAAVGADVPAGLALVTAGADGGLTACTGPARPVVPGTTVQIDVVLDAADRDLVFAVDGAEVPVPAHGAGLRTVDAAGPIVVTCGAARCTIDAAVPAAAATLRLHSPHGARWSVTDGTGGAWFAEGVPAKWDSDDRPFFHTGPGTTDLTVPAGPLHVVAARGIEFARLEVDVTPAVGETVTVAYDPERRFDPAADGWYGATRTRSSRRATTRRGTPTTCSARSAWWRPASWWPTPRSVQRVSTGGETVDAVELVSCFDDRGAVVLHHHPVPNGGRRGRAAGAPRAGRRAAAGVGELEHEVTVDGGLWLAAAAYGDTDPHTVGAPGVRPRAPGAAARRPHRSTRPGPSVLSQRLLIGAACGA